MRSLAQTFGYVLIGQLDLHVGSTGVGELIALVCVLQVTQQPSEFRRDVIVAVFLGNHLVIPGGEITILPTRNAQNVSNASLSLVFFF